MTAYRRVYDSRHLQANCREPGSAPEPYAPLPSMGSLYLLVADTPVRQLTTNRGHATKPFIIYISLTIDAYETTT